ncbi:metallophosphoesterase [Polymorphobacter fuscus]|uniref:Calcineurin-like phosphoesterase domain-containing protein n=1 Tax=Sandarakinorhabdus fusca TaxID=1439888 RepID=A0A7C9GWJ2_9SPHN|nr:metallophosphoesterase [Polymorphobacter fuscus]KAB7644361.1 metallophosphoesterase [Polymorphobacter fuscus]MQT18278.1 hypothetical protein [Polymorphobacter fuscus]NJC08172.1 hypothetical protein [Polymorphobacter fuscus]
MPRILLILLAAALALPVLLGAWGVMSAVQDPRIARYTVAMPGLRAPLRVIQLSDSHASAIDMPPQRLQRVVAMINARKPDLIVLTGDYVSGNPDSWTPAQTRAALAPFNDLAAPLGVYAALGNHDDRAKTAPALVAGPVRLLVGTRADAGPVTIVGADDVMRGSPAVEDMRRAIRRAPRDKPVLVIVHEPTYFQWLQTRPVLMLAGHTHGGQIKLPILGAWSINAYYAAHQRGLFRAGAQTMIVSSGLGTTNVPVRIGVPPEIVELTLVPGGQPLASGGSPPMPADQPGRKSGTDR